MRRVIGWLLTLSPFIIPTVFFIYKVGVLAYLFIIGLAALLTAIMTIGLVILGDQSKGRHGKKK